MRPTEFPPVSSTAARRGSQDTLICFSHLRWNFVFQRPQHLITRFADDYDVIIWEEPEISQGAEPRLNVREVEKGIRIATPCIPQGLDTGATEAELRRQLNQLLTGITGRLVRWYYTPMMFGFSKHLNASFTVYDCMDELSAFAFAPPQLIGAERDLFAAADVVFTGGWSIYETKSAQHDNVHAFPSSVDKAHFAQARRTPAAEVDGATIGFYGVVDERFDCDLITQVADLRPEIRFEIVGPVVKIDPATLPQRDNIAFLPPQPYSALPECLARWNVAMMPFAMNEATRFISPTKTPEYLAAGRPVVSTPIRDVERHYGDTPGVLIAGDAEGFAAACDAALALAKDPETWLPAVDAQLAELSWDKTHWQMNDLIAQGLVRNASLVKLRTGRQEYDYVIVGAGFAGSVMAERLANDAGKRVLVIDKRHHIAGNAYDEEDAAGILVHRYGPHIFHTNSAEIFAYLSQFTSWRPYEHRVLARVNDIEVPIPINRTTLNALYNAGLETEEDAAAFLASRAEPVDTIRTSEDVVVSAVGRELYSLFFRGYTRKQWALDPSELDKSVTARIPTRTNTDDRYFTDTFQGMPDHGYTQMFEAMLDHPNIDVRLGVSWAEVANLVSFNRLVWTGAIDEYFGHCFGKLPYRSLRFEHRTLAQEQYQKAGTVNYPDEAVPYTRITEFKHLTGQDAPETSIVFEYPEAEGDPYYPIPQAANQALYQRYARLADASDTIFVGRLATYRYYNMDQIVGQALATYRRLRQAEIKPVTVAEMSKETA